MGSRGELNRTLVLFSLAAAFFILPIAAFVGNEAELVDSPFGFSCSSHDCEFIDSRLEIINSQSYPTVNGFWTVLFDTDGKNDLIVGKDGVQTIAKSMTSAHVSYDIPENIPHHKPELAIGSIKKYLKKY